MAVYMHHESISFASLKILFSCRNKYLIFKQETVYFLHEVEITTNHNATVQH